MTSKTISVVIIVNELLRGGAQRIILDIARGIDKRQFSITVTYLKSHKNFGEKAATLEEEFRRANVRVISLEGAQKFSFLDLLKLIRFLRDERPDIVHTFLPYAGTLGRIAARIARVPRIMSTQCNVRVAYGFKGYWYDRITLVLAHAWTAATEGIELEYGGSAAPFSRGSWALGRRHFSISAGVDLSAFDARIAACDKNAKRAEIGIPKDVPLVMMTARLISWKGPTDLVEAMRYVPRAHLIIVGWGPLQKRLAKQARDNGSGERVHLLGARSDVAELLAAADVYVQAHNRSADGDIWAGPNLSQIEACAAKIPSVSTRVPLIECLIEDGITGKLAEPNNPRSLAAAIQWVIDHPKEARAMALAARERVRERYTVEHMVNQYAGMYLSL